MATLTGGQAIVESLKAHGVDTIFGLIATSTIDIYDALYDAKVSIRFIGGRHEHAVAFMADGYSRATGRPGVCLTSGGPGAANSMGAMGEAFAASSKVLQITSNTNLHLIGSKLGGVHETKDQVGMFDTVTGWSALIDNLEAIPDHFLEAFQRFKDRRPRPVELEVPRDLLGQKADVEILPPRELPQLRPDSAKIEQAARVLLKARRPLIWAGNGVISAQATEELKRLAEALGAAVVTSTTAKGAFPGDHPLSLGAGEFRRGENPLIDFIGSCDLALIVGSSMAYFRTVQGGLKLPSNLIQIDVDPDEIGKNYPASVGIVGDAGLALRQILALVEAANPSPDDGFLQDVARSREACYQTVARLLPNELKTWEAIRGVMARDAIVVCDPTIPAYVASRCLEMYEPRTYFFIPDSWGGLGTGFPMGLGAKVGRPDRQVVIVTGDGGFQFNIQELATAVQYGINPVILLFNDNAWGVLKASQGSDLNGRYIATDLNNPDFVKLADAYGVAATRVTTRDQLANALGNALDSKALHLVVVETPQGFAAFQ